MSKADDDNRSNQLNPNNAAYWSSRDGGSVGCTYDDDDEESPHSFVSPPNFSPRPDVQVERAFEFGFAGIHGQVRFVRVNFSVVLGPHEQSCGYDFLDYVEFFAEQLWSLFSQRWKGVKLQMVFDDRGREIQWLTQPCTAESVEVQHTVSDPVWPRMNLIGPGESVVMRDLLLRARSVPSTDWGDFVASKYINQLERFEHLERCKAMVNGDAYREPEARPKFQSPIFGI